MTNMTFKVFHNCHRQIGPVCRDGTTSTMVRADPQPAFEGNAADTVLFLRDLGVGASVEVRRYADGEMIGARSCMNKPALWTSLHGGQANA
ncbi:MAG: hypothetical protein NXI16_01425 [Alphaproteobacteria bacterium]|nr:hypothetical protein [Alphaproteobacteria bacterium]